MVGRHTASLVRAEDLSGRPDTAARGLVSRASPRPSRAPSSRRLRGRQVRSRHPACASPIAVVVVVTAGMVIAVSVAVLALVLASRLSRSRSRSTYGCGRGRSLGGRACPGHPRRAASRCCRRVRRRCSLGFPTVCAAVDSKVPGRLGGIVGTSRRGWSGLRPAMTERGGPFPVSPPYITMDAPISIL